MVWVYGNPVQIVFGAGCLAELPRLLANRRFLLVTYADPAFAALRRRIERLGAVPAMIVDDVAPNPNYELLAEQTARLGQLRHSVDAIVALGGGSVIDTAKVLAAADGDFVAVRRFLETRNGSERLGATPILAVPTTAGTGSEVTCWSTIWDEAKGVKHSLAFPGLYPETALVDPELTLGKPRGLTIATGLDALSHALESLWNRNANPVSMGHAVTAACEIIEVLPRVADDLGDLGLRSRMASAALFAGLAFSNTKTAIAHSISYPVTLRHGVPHGIACSFTLPAIARSVRDLDGICREGLSRIFGRPIDAADELEAFLGRLGIATEPVAYGIPAEAWRAIVNQALNGERGQNFIGSPDALLSAMVGARA